jgi:hypothetical protein
MTAQQYSTESFRGDFESLASVVKQSWSENQNQSLLYDEEFLRSAFEYPGASFDLAPTIYVDSLPAAFVGAFPRTVRFQGREQRLPCLTFWTTATEFKGRGFGSQVWMDALRRVKEAGYDGALNFCVDGAATNGIVVACGERMKARVHRLFSAKYLARILRPGPGTQTSPGPEIVDLFLRAAGQVSESVPLRRVWSREEAEWQCLRRAGGVRAAVVAGSRGGVATGYIVEVIDATPIKALLVEDLLWGDLEAQERLGLLKQLLDRGAAAGAKIAVAPLMGYAETETLRGLGFRQSRRLMHAYLTVWNSDPVSEPLSSLYLDVY